MAQSGRRR
ncbi:unnamed protein product, partial [Rotaria sordida]